MHIVQVAAMGWFAFLIAWAAAWIVTREVTRRRARAEAMRRHPSALASDEHAVYAARLIAELEADLIIAAQENQQ